MFSDGPHLAHTDSRSYRKNRCLAMGVLDSKSSGFVHELRFIVDFEPDGANLVGSGSGNEVEHRSKGVNRSDFVPGGRWKRRTR